LIAIFTTSAITFTPNWNLNPKIRVFTQQKGNYDCFLENWVFFFDGLDD
jgi:hypothetical protein